MGVVRTLRTGCCRMKLLPNMGCSLWMSKEGLSPAMSPPYFTGTHGHAHGTQSLFKQQSLSIQNCPQWQNLPWYWSKVFMDLLPLHSPESLFKEKVLQILTKASPATLQRCLLSFHIYNGNYITQPRVHNSQVIFTIFWKPRRWKKPQSVVCH